MIKTEFGFHKPYNKLPYMKCWTVSQKHICKLITRLLPSDTAVCLSFRSFWIDVDENWYDHLLQVMGGPERGVLDL